RGRQPVSVRDEKERALHTVGPQLGEESLVPAEPTFGRTDLLAQNEAEADPECGARRLLDFTGVEMEMVRTFVGGDRLVVAAEHVRRRREQAEICRPEWLRLVRAAEKRVRVGPGPGRGRAPSPLECARRLPL